MKYSLLAKFGTETLSSCLAMYFGLGVVANDHLCRTKGGKFGFGFIAFGFGMAFAIPIVMFGFVSAHLNPAMSLALFILGKMDWKELLVCCGGEFLGMFVGAFLMYLHYLPHFILGPSTDVETQTDEAVIHDKKMKLSVFATGPAIPASRFHTFWNEFICTTVLITCALGVFSRHAQITNGDLLMVYRSIEGITIGWLVFVAVLGLGGVTSIAANPARDFSPRLVHFIVPIANKGNSQWAYAWIPFVASFAGGAVASQIFRGISMITNYGI